VDQPETEAELTALRRETDRHLFVYRRTILANNCHSNGRLKKVDDGPDEPWVSHDGGAPIRDGAGGSSTNVQLQHDATNIKTATQRIIVSPLLVGTRG
jgi:hypothetical protein